MIQPDKIEKGSQASTDAEIREVVDSIRKIRELSRRQLRHGGLFAEIFRLTGGAQSELTRASS